jgi:hypothetical protein
MNLAQVFFIFAGLVLLIEAVGYSLGALRPLHNALAPGDPSLNRRLLLNLMLANSALYLTSLYTFVGAYIQRISSRASAPVIAVSLAACCYSVVTIPVLTPKDWMHAIFRGLAGGLIIVGLVAG